MLEWSYDDEGASADMPGLDNPTFFVNRALVGSGYVAMEFFPDGLRVTQPVSSLSDGIAWCEKAAQQSAQRTAASAEPILGLCDCDRCKQMRGEL